MIALDFFFFGDFSYYGLTVLQSSNKLVFALIPNMTEDNQNKTKTMKK